MLALTSCGSSQDAVDPADCVTTLDSVDWQFDTLLSVDEYVAEVTDFVLGMPQRDQEREFGACSRQETLRYLLMRHPQIDAVSITESGRGVSYSRTDSGVWANILID